MLGPIYCSSVLPANLGKLESRRADSNRLPLLQLRVIGQGCWGVQRLANPPYLGGFLRSALLRVAPYCVPGGIRVVSILPSYMASTKGFLRCGGMNARRRV